MSAIAVAEPGARTGGGRTPSGFDRVWRVVRLHYANRMNAIIVPINTTAFIVAVYLIVQGIIVYATRDNADAGQGLSPGLVYFLPYQIVFAVQAMNLTFSYALGMSSTRRDFSLGTWLMFLIQSAAFSIAFTLLSYAEEWTGGWGLHAAIFHSAIYGTGGFGQRLLTFFGGIVLFQCIGSVFGAVFVRWRTTGMYVLGGALVLLLLGTIALITFTESWGAVGRWFVAVGPAGFAAWLLVPAAVFAVIGHLALRRATPKS
jgi:hypothetical protein